MLMLPKRRKPEKKSPGPSPLDLKAQALTEAQNKLQAEIEARERLIKDAPRIAQEQQRKRREELVKRASRTEVRPGSRVALQDRRHVLEFNSGAPAQHKRLRRERRQGRLLFFFLLCTFGAVLYWDYFTFTHQ
jgi:hypothetical protein